MLQNLEIAAMCIIIQCKDVSSISSASQSNCYLCSVLPSWLYLLLLLFTYLQKPIILFDTS